MLAAVFLPADGAVALAAAPWMTSADRAAACYGTAVASAGDVNGDGYHDILVGAPGPETDEQGRGRVSVYHGSASGLSTTANWRAERNQAHAVFGTSVASAGDVNKDGYDDILVGSPGDSPGHSKAGAAFVYHGSASGLGTRPSAPSGPTPQPDWRVESNREGACLGWSVASAGDVNNDGFADIIVGAPWYGNGQAREGAAFVYHGSASGLSTARSAPGGPTPKPDWRVESDQEGASLGWSVATAGDVNADGYDEVIVGADYFDKGQADEGAAFVHHGSAAGLGPAAAWTGESDQEYSYFGRSVATAGDVNRDGYSELVIGAPWYDAAGYEESGAAFVYPGGAAGFEAAPARTAFLRW